MKRIIFIVFILIACNKNIEVNRDIESDEYKNKVENDYKIIDGIDFDDSKIASYKKNAETGLLLSEKNPGSYWDNFVEKVFINPISKRKIHYSGEYWRGPGTFWIKEEGKKLILLEEDISYGPMIIWHGANIAEIFIPYGNPAYESFYYDFEENIISQRYNFPLYFDIENKVILTWGERDFELYDLRTDKLIREYNYRRFSEMTAAWPYIGYYIEKENEKTILLFYNDWSAKIKGRFIIDIAR